MSIIFKYNVYIDFYFFLKRIIKYQKIEKLPKLCQNMHRCANDNLHLIWPTTHSVQLYCRLWAVFFDKLRNDVPNALGSIAFLDFTDAECTMHQLYVDR